MADKMPETPAPTVAQPVFIVPPQPNFAPPPPEPEAVPGGKFGIRDFEVGKDGKRKEVIRWVDAEGNPFEEKDDDKDEAAARKSSAKH